MNLIAMILCAVKIYPRPGLEPLVLEVLESLRGLIGTSADCLGCSVSVETGGSGAICYAERWRSREALDRHFRSPLYCRVLEAMECSCLPPEVEFYEVEKIGGLEQVEQARISH